jgi:hypothetical protein
MPTAISIDTLRAFSSEISGMQKESAATLPDKWTAAALLAGGAIGSHVLKKAVQDWKNGRQMRVQQASYGGY